MRCIARSEAVDTTSHVHSAGRDVLGSPDGSSELQPAGVPAEAQGSEHEQRTRPARPVSRHRRRDQVEAVRHHDATVVSEATPERAQLLVHAACACPEVIAQVLRRRRGDSHALSDGVSQVECTWFNGRHVPPRSSSWVGMGSRRRAKGGGPCGRSRLSVGICGARLSRGEGAPVGDAAARRGAPS